MSGLHQGGLLFVFGIMYMHASICLQVFDYIATTVMIEFTHSWGCWDTQQCSLVIFSHVHVKAQDISEQNNLRVLHNKADSKLVHAVSNYSVQRG